MILALGAIFVGSVVSACGSAIPGNSVAVVAGNPITARALAHWGYVAAVGQSQASPGSPIIVPDPPKYTKCIASLRKIAPATIPASELKTACVSQFTQTLEYLVRSAWVQGQAASEGIKVSNASVMAKFNAAKNGQFKTQAQFQQFLTATGQTLNDILYRFRVSELATKLATPAAVAAYYKAHAASYSTPERRNVRIILAKTQARANAALAALRSGKSWAVTAKKYSVDTATKNTGGLLTGVVNGQEPAALNSAIFAASTGKLLGPLKSPFGYYVAEVTSVSPATTEALAKATPTIKSTLAQAALSAPPWEKKWKAKTTCRTGFEVVDCSGYVAPKTTSTTTPTPTTSTVTPTTPTVTPTPTTGTTTTKKK
ncbi:MAG TPA: peptidylprolyl isomerase [Solirubrobacteraceae bacterium]|nr:peptidylprolyl isomerase [Solirubrobacteraceae bacterium]